MMSTIQPLKGLTLSAAAAATVLSVLAGFASSAQAFSIKLFDNVVVQPTTGSGLDAGTIKGTAKGSVGITVIRGKNSTTTGYTLEWAANLLHGQGKNSSYSANPISVVFSGNSRISDLIQIPIDLSFSDSFKAGSSYKTAFSFIALASNDTDDAIGDLTESTTWSTLPAEEVPTPALLPGLVGLGAAALRKRKGEAEETAEA